ncbi:putative Tyrosine-protein kinase BAZ1B [Nannochloris sp. 'desiccata']|nr:putative Tyrosine-protein kinase BAZ1B [Chlorella desiccata (nom. nud.)]
MPLCDGEEHQLLGALPPGVKGPADELLLLRFTGEVFDKYEDYIKALNFYRQRIWSCKYTGEAGLTYEEAAASEHKILQVISRFPAAAEEAAAKLVHHSLEPLDALKTSIVKLVEDINDPASKATPELASQWIYSIATPQPVAGVPGVECIWKLYEHFRLKFNFPEDPPPELAERIRPVRQKQAAAGGAAAVHVDANGFGPTTMADGNNGVVGGINGQGGISSGLLPGGDIDGQFTDDLEEHGVHGGAVDDNEGGESDYGDDDYKPSRFSVEDLPWRARGRGRGGAASRGAAAAGRGRGRGRGRWGRKSITGEEEIQTAGSGLDSSLAGEAVQEAGAGLEPSPLDTAAAPPTSVTAPTANALPSSMQQPSDEDLQLMIESLEDVERRMQPGSIKHGVLTLLKEVGESGMSINELATTIMERGLKHWDEVRQARNSIASTCGHDPAFVRVAPGKFALRCLVPISQLRAMAVPLPTAQRGNLGEVASRQLAAVEAAQAEAMRKLAEQKSKKGELEKNNFKCPKCHRVAHAELSPLILCDTCPRSYHVACLGLKLSELPTGDWCCPKCVENVQAVLRRVMDLEAKKKEALERAVSKDKAAEDKLLRRLLAKEGKEGSAAGVGGGSATRHRGGAGGNQAAGGGGPRSTGHQVGGGSASKDGANRQPRRVLDDWEVLEEEKKHLAKLKLRVKELQDLAARGHNADGGGTADVSMMEPSSLPHAGSLASQPSLPGSSFDEGDDTVATRALHAAEALEKLKLIIQGPPAQGFPRLLSDPSATAALAEASTVAEFLALYGAVCEVDRDLTTVELVSAAAWPLDAAAELSPLYRQLLLCCLLEQLNRDPPVRGRTRRWFATLTDATWPEVLRRYLLATRVNDVVKIDDGTGIGGGGNGDDDEEGDTGGNMATTDSSRKQQQESSQQLDLLTSASLLEPLYDIDPLEMNDRQLAIHCAALLSRGGWWELPAVCHLRLLGMLCYDIAQGQNLRDDINTRVADCTKLQADWAKEFAAARRQQQKRAAAGGADGGAGLDFSANKRRKSGKKGSLANLVLEGTTQNDNTTESLNGDEDTQDEELGGGLTSTTTGLGGISAAREAEIEAELMQRAYRTDPLGLDRHSHRYWWLRGNPSHILVENAADGSPAGVLTSREQIDDLISKLNVRGPKEGELHSNLRKKYNEICDAFEEEEEQRVKEGDDKGKKNKTSSSKSANAAAAAVFDIFNVPRPMPTDGRIKVKDLPALASAATTAAVVDAKEQIDAFITETQEMGLVFAADLKILKRELKAVETPASLCDYLLHVERYYAPAAEGLPAGAKNDELTVLLGEDEVRLLPELISLPLADADAAAAAKEEAEQEDAAEVKKEEEREAERMETADGLEANPAKDYKVKKENEDSESSRESDEKDDGHQTQGTSTAAAGGGGGFGGGSTRGNTAAAAPPAALRPVSLTDEFDDSDAEHAYLREKRMRRPARLWRSPRERAVWLKLVLNAKKATTDGRLNAGAQAAYCTHMLYDRGSKMLKIAAKLAEDTAKWEEAEAARQKAEAARNSCGTGAGGRANGDIPAATAERPLMIRTGKFKSKDGMRIILKSMGKDPFPPGRQATADGTAATEEDIARCRWGYQCGVCMLAGDLLCCEHPDGCAVSVHPTCTGLPFPQGPWICSNHEEGRGRVRRQRSCVGGDFETGYIDSEMTESEEEEEKNSEEDSDSDDDDSASHGGESGGRRKRSRR